MDIVSPGPPQAAIELQHVWVGSDTGGLEIQNPQRTQALCSRQSHVSLPHLETPAQGQFHTVQCHALGVEGGGGGRGEGRERGGEGGVDEREEMGHIIKGNL